MQGKILDYNTEYKSGLIRGTDDKKYSFRIEDCKSSTKPRTGAEVDFEVREDKAIDIYILTKDTIDDIKSIASSATDTTVTAVKATVITTKKIFPILKIIAVIVGISIFIFGYLVPELERQKEEAKAQQLMNDYTKLHIEGDRLFKKNNYLEALSKYEAAATMADTYSLGDRWYYDYKAAECYLGMNKPLKALSLLGNPAVEFGRPTLNQLLPDAPATEDNGFFSAQQSLRSQTMSYSQERKALACVIASKAYQMSGDMYSAKVFADFACKNGDCSLVEK